MTAGYDTARDRDDAERIVAAFAQAAERGQGLRIGGSGSKTRRYPMLAGTAQAPSLELVSVAEHRGITHYAPDELVLEARAGTPLTDIEQVLARQRQMLAFEPPRFAGGGTLGGAVAAGLSGPARPWRGSLRDAVLGVEMVNGLGERLQFGGRVVKNVAGYDLSRLQVGAFGTFGALLRICLRVLPQPASTCTVLLECDVHAALERMAGWSTQSLPITASSFADGQLRVRLQGAPEAVAAAQQSVGGAVIAGAPWWDALRDQSHPAFAQEAKALWRAVVPIGTTALAGDDQSLLEWGGAVRWYQAPTADLLQQVTAVGGWAQPYRRPNLAGPSGATAELAARLRHAFDPQQRCNPHLVAETAQQGSH